MNNKTKGTWHRPIQVDVMFLFSLHTTESKISKISSKHFAIKKRFITFAPRKPLHTFFVTSKLKKLKQLR